MKNNFKRQILKSRIAGPTDKADRYYQTLFRVLSLKPLLNLDVSIFFLLVGSLDKLLYLTGSVALAYICHYISDLIYIVEKLI